MDGLWHPCRSPRTEEESLQILSMDVFLGAGIAYPLLLSVSYHTERDDGEKRGGVFVRRRGLSSKTPAQAKVKGRAGYTPRPVPPRIQYLLVQQEQGPARHHLAKGDTVEIFLASSRHELGRRAMAIKGLRLRLPGPALGPGPVGQNGRFVLRALRASRVSGHMVHFRKHGSQVVSDGSKPKRVTCGG